jgi:hypothetical protein
MARTTGSDHESIPSNGRTTNVRWGCPALLPIARKDHKLQPATDRSAEKSLCVLCALRVSVVKLLVVKL